MSRAMVDWEYVGDWYLSILHWTVLTISLGGLIGMSLWMLLG